MSKLPIAGEDIHKGDLLYMHLLSLSFFVFRDIGTIHCQAARDIKKGEEMTSTDTEPYTQTFVPHSVDVEVSSE